MTKLRISHFTGGYYEPTEAYYVWAKRGNKAICLGEFLTRKEAEACFKEHLMHIGMTGDSDYLWEAAPR